MNCLERGIPLGIRAAAIACCLSFGLAAQAEPASNKPAAAAAAKPGALAAPMPDKTKDDPVKVDAARAFILAFHPLLAPAAVADKLDQVMPDMIAREKDNNPKLDVKKFEQDTRNFRAAKKKVVGPFEQQGQVGDRGVNGLDQRQAGSERKRLRGRVARAERNQGAPEEIAALRNPLTALAPLPSRLFERNEPVALDSAGIGPGPDSQEPLARMRAQYEPYVIALADYLLLTLPPWSSTDAHADNWETSAWENAHHF